jgi:hypothetical protein
MSFIDAAKHAVHNVFKETVEAVTTVSNVSQFREKGVLTPDEFVAAGAIRLPLLVAGTFGGCALRSRLHASHWRKLSPLPV